MRVSTSPLAHATVESRSTRPIVSTLGILTGIAAVMCATTPRVTEPQSQPPILDMHLHALRANDQGPPPVGVCVPFERFEAWDQTKSLGEQFMTLLKQPPCLDPVWSPTTDTALMHETIAVMRRFNIYGVLSGTPALVAAWREAEDSRFIPGLAFQVGRDSITPDSMRALHSVGQFAVLAEVSNQYAGILPDDPRMEPYWKLAEDLDIPVGIHVGPGPPGVIYLGARHYRGRMHSALTMEEVLVRHPRLRVYLMHAGYPLLDDLLALLYAHPQVHVDIGVIVFTQPTAAFYRYLQRIIEAGFGDRVMFGSDQMVWPGVIERSIRIIEQAPFLTQRQKRDILYNNAARFLRLSQETIAQHHGSNIPP